MAGFDDGRRGHEPRNTSSKAPEDGKVKKTESSLEPAEIQGE